MQKKMQKSFWPKAIPYQKSGLRRISEDFTKHVKRIKMNFFSGAKDTPKEPPIVNDKPNSNKEEQKDGNQ